MLCSYNGIDKKKIIDMIVSCFKRKVFKLTLQTKYTVIH